jgi:hypothetical protein
MLDSVFILGIMIKSYYINILNLNSNLLLKYPLKHLDLLQPYNSIE